MDTTTLEQVCGVSTGLMPFTEMEEHLGGSLLSFKLAKNENLEVETFFSECVNGTQN